MATQTITTQRTFLKPTIRTESWLPPAVARNAEDKYDVDYEVILHRVEKAIILVLPTIWATYSFFHRFLDAQSSFSLALIYCTPLPDLYFFFETIRAERMTAIRNQTPKRNISITDQRPSQEWRHAHREFS